MIKTPVGISQCQGDLGLPDTLVFALAPIFQWMGLIPGSALIFKTNDFFIWVTDLSFSSTFLSKHSLI